MARTPAAVELFAGGGGMALGTHRAGFRHVALLEREPNAVETLRRNSEEGTGVSPELLIQQTDVTQFRYEVVEDSIDLLAAGAPCQPFSLGGKHAGQRDHRNLFPEVFRAQRFLRPKAVLTENVSGLARKGFRPYLEYILLELALPGLPPGEGEDWRLHKKRLMRALATGEMGDRPSYHAWLASLDCANFGVPQRRNRIFIVALRTDLGVRWQWPPETHARRALLHAKFVTRSYWKEHGLPAPSPNGCRAGLNGRRSPGRARWRTVRDALAHVPEPTDGKPHPFHPNHVGVPGARSYPGHTGSPLDEPAKTLKAGVHGVPGGENMLRRADGSVRYFTVHEAARLQTFPKRYVFHGSRTEAIRQIGNAAPVRVIQVLADRLRKLIESAPGSGSETPCVDLLEAPRSSP